MVHADACSKKGKQVCRKCTICEIVLKVYREKEKKGQIVWKMASFDNDMKPIRKYFDESILRNVNICNVENSFKVFTMFKNYVDIILILIEH